MDGYGPTTQAVGGEAWHEGVAQHLYQQLLDWLCDRVSSSYGVKLSRITARLQVDGAALKYQAQVRQNELTGVQLNPAIRYVSDKDILKELVYRDPQGLLYLVHLVLGELEEGVNQKQARKEMEAILNNGRSVWRVAADGRSLMRRVAEPVAQGLQSAAAAARPSAASHLTAAWQYAYAMQPDPSRAYSEAIKAVEAAIIPVVQPGFEKATLGTAIAKLNEQGPGQWWFAIPARDPADGLVPLVAMLRLLWQSQTDRHAGESPTKPPSVESAHAAVTLAVTLVHWLSTGALRRRAQPINIPAGQTSAKPAAAQGKKQRSQPAAAK